MTAIARTKTLMSAVTGTGITTVKVSRIVKRYLEAKSIDTSVLTNEQIAQSFLDNLKIELKNAAAVSAVDEHRAGNKVAETAAINSSNNDFN